MKYLVSHQGCTIIFDDKRRCKNCSKAHDKDETIESYLKGIVKLIVSVNVNNDWILFGQEMRDVVTKLMNVDEQPKHRKDECEKN